VTGSFVTCSFVVCGLTFVVCGLTYVVCGLTFVVCGLTFVLCGLTFVVCGLTFRINFRVTHTHTWYAVLSRSYETDQRGNEMRQGVTWCVRMCVCGGGGCFYRKSGELHDGFWIHWTKLRGSAVAEIRRGRGWTCIQVPTPPSATKGLPIQPHPSEANHHSIKIKRDPLFRVLCNFILTKLRDPPLRCGRVYIGSCGGLRITGAPTPPSQHGWSSWRCETVTLTHVSMEMQVQILIFLILTLCRNAGRKKHF
jgi:hypothetical protein